MNPVFNRWLFRKGQPPVQYLDTLLKDIPGTEEEQAMVVSIRPDGNVMWYCRKPHAWDPVPKLKKKDPEVPGEYLIQLLLIK